MQVTFEVASAYCIEKQKTVTFRLNLVQRSFHYE